MAINVMTAVFAIGKSLPLNHADRLILLALADCADDNGVCWPSQATLARKAATSRRYVKVALAKFAVLGLLESENRLKQTGAPDSNSYTLAYRTWPREPEQVGKYGSPQVGNPSSPGGEVRFPTVGKRSSPGVGKRSSHEPSIEPSIEPSLNQEGDSPQAATVVGEPEPEPPPPAKAAKPRPPKPDDWALACEHLTPDSPLRTPAFEAAWRDWAADRRKRGKTITPLAIKRQLKNLEAWGHDNAIRAIENAITAGWIGLVEPKDGRAGGKGGNHQPTPYQQRIREKIVVPRYQLSQDEIEEVYRTHPDMGQSAKPG